MDVGTQLRTSREAKHLSLEALSRTTRVQARMLAAIEENDASALPPRPFGRGFVRAYAREVGLDPDRTVRDYFSQFTASESPVETLYAERPLAIQPETNGRRGWIATAILVAAALGAAVLVARQSSRAAADPSVVGTAGRAAAPATSISPDTTHRPAAGSTAPSAAAAPERALDVAIFATQPSWITATADGQRVVYRLMNTGERAALRATREVTIRAGNAGGITWTINGRERGPLGAPGAVANATARLDNGRVIVAQR